MIRRIPVTRSNLATYLVLDLERAGGRAVSIINEAVRGGVGCLQLRDKRGSMAQVERIAAEVRGMLLRQTVPLIINDRLDVALGVGADGVHVGQTDESVASIKARAELAGAANLAIGVSVTTVAEGRTAVAAGATHLSVSPVFATASKPDAPKAAGLEGVRALRRAMPEIPLVGIGGVHRHNAREVIAAGADGVAFVSVVTHAANPASESRAIASAVKQALAERVPVEEN